jgi:hypothetical protein
METILMKLSITRFKLLFILLIAASMNMFISSTSLAAENITKALDQAAEYFVKSAVRIQSGKKLIISEVVNYNSKKFDALGKKIQNELYFALERQWPDYKLFVGAPEPDQVCISGTYEKKAHNVVIKLQAFSGCGKPEILGQVTVSYKEIKKRRKTLVAVLDIESNELNPAQIRGFSEIFRSELDKIGKFDIASSADVYKFDPDAVQKTTGCTRDECANIIGEQMGVDRVISSSMFKIADTHFVLSGKMLNIQTGEIVVSRTVNHNGKLSTFQKALQNLANSLTGEESDNTDIVEQETSPVFKVKEPIFTQEDSAQTNPAGIEEESWVSKNIWHISAISTATVGLFGMNQYASDYNELSQENKDLQEEYETETNPGRLAAIDSKIEKNKSDMESLKQGYQTMQILLIAGISWETYLLIWGGEDQVQKSAQSSYTVPTSFKLALTTDPGSYGSGIQAAWRW